MSPRRQRLMRLWQILACFSLLISLLSPLATVEARASAASGGIAATTSGAKAQLAPTPTGSPILIASLAGAGQIGPEGIVPLLITSQAGVGESLATLEASASGADGQW